MDARGGHLLGLYVTVSIPTIIASSTTSITFSTFLASHYRVTTRVIQFSYSVSARDMAAVWWADGGSSSLLAVWVDSPRRLFANAMLCSVLVSLNAKPSYKQESQQDRTEKSEH